jgi:uroporphyrinogen-III synthase
VKKTGSIQPLKGMRVLVGRARHQASALSAGLRAAGAAILEIPFIEIQKPRSYAALDQSLHDLPQYQWLIFTSTNGVNAFFKRMRHRKIDRKQLAHLSIAAIGPATKRAIESEGMRIQVVPDEYVAEAVVESLRDKVMGKRILLARARVARDVIPQELSNLGATVDVVEVYETVIPEDSRRKLRVALKNPKTRPHVIAFTSSSTVRHFKELAGSVDLSAIKMASIGPITSATLRELELPVDVEAREYTIPGLITAIQTLYGA